MWKGIRYYPGKNHNRLNGLPFLPERITPFVCVNPLYPVVLENPEECRPLTDSAAFQDVSSDSRLTFPAALERQLTVERKGGFISDKLVSYDKLIDEQNVDGRRFKERWDMDAAAGAVEETVEAAKFLASRRTELRPRKLVLSNQGVSIAQYTECVRRVLEVAEPGDTIGYGGFCIIGQRLNSPTVDSWQYPGCTYREQFLRIVRKTIPMIAAAGVTEVHVFGVLVVPVLREALAIANAHGISLSTDSTSVERNSVMTGRVWDGDGFGKRLGRPLKWTETPTPPEGFWHPNLLAHDNIRRVVESLTA